MYVVGGIVLAVVFGLIAAKPHAWWRLSQGWAHRHPDAVQPSGVAYGLSSLAAAVLAVVCLVGGFVVQHTVSARASTEDGCGRAESAIADLTDATDLIDTLDRAGFDAERERLNPGAGEDFPAKVTVTRDGDEVGTIYLTSEDEAPQLTCGA